VTLRLDLWHNHAQHTGGLPKDIEGLSMEEVEDHLGFCRSARYRAMPKLHWPEDGSSRNNRATTPSPTTGFRRERSTPWNAAS